MSEVLSSESFIFNTDLGPVLLISSQVKEYDIDDMVQRQAFAVAQDLIFQAVAENLSPNAVKLPRTITSSYAQQV